jgi:hypothetical protein
MRLIHMQLKLMIIIVVISTSQTFVTNVTIIGVVTVHHTILVFDMQRRFFYYLQVAIEQRHMSFHFDFVILLDVHSQAMSSCIINWAKFAFNAFGKALITPQIDVMGVRAEN